MLFVKAGLIALFAVSVSAAARNAYFDGLYARSLDHSALFARGEGECGCPAGTTFSSSNKPDRPCFGKCLDQNGKQVYRKKASQSSGQNKGGQSSGQNKGGQAGGNEPGGQDAKQGGAGGSEQKKLNKRSLGWSEDEFDLAARDADPEADAEFDFDDELLYSRDFLDEFYGGGF